MKVFKDENEKFTFDFTKAIWAFDKLNEVYNEKVKSTLSDVDFIAETEDAIIFVEYKNVDWIIEGAVNPSAFKNKIKDDKHYIKIAQKYYGSLIYILACNKKKNYKFVYILECNDADSVMRKFIRNKIRTKLPFELNAVEEVKMEVINSFEILSIEEWNMHSEYSQFPIKEIG